MTVSIIIAVKTWQKNLEECVNKCLELDFPKFEIIILPDNPFDSVIGEQRRLNTENLNTATIPLYVIPTGPLSPAHKRDIALKYAKGEILAFIDDDAYPVTNWLKNAVSYFENEDIAAVCGPAVTPLNDTIKQKASGEIFSSILVSAKFIYRYTPKRKQEVDDYPSCNFLARKSIMLELGGFNTKFWPGEDTKLCLDITKRLHKKIFYDPAVLVYHHRRPVFLPHLKQTANYALHRGYFVKRYHQTSFKAAYFLPGIFILGLFFGGIISLFFAPFRLIYFSGLFVYVCLTLLLSFNNNLLLFLYIFLGTMLTHITYGIYFLKGLLSSQLPEEKQAN